MEMTPPRKKLIEVALPLDAINAASAREKSIRHGHPSTLHLWWARRPLAAARAVIFAQMVDDPSACPEEFPTEADQKQERERLFRLIEELVRWENITNEELLKQARAEIRRSWRRTCAGNAGHPRAAELFDPDRLPAFHDPFAGGGALPLEAQRLGLEAHASDLNPVAVLINKAMIEIPPKFAGRPPVNPEARPGGSSAKAALIERGWTGAQGLAEDVRYYGQWMRDEAERRIGHLYPPVEVTAEMVRGAARPQAVPGPQADGDRLAVGADREESEPGLRRRRRAAGHDLHAVDETGQGGVCRPGDRGARVPVRREGGGAAGCRGGQVRDQAGTGSELSLCDVGVTDGRGLHQDRGKGQGGWGRG